MKKILLVLLGLGVIGAFVGYRMWNKPHQNMQSAKTDLAIDAGQLLKEFNTDENAANAKYLEKTIAVNGKVREVTKDEGTVKVVLETGEEFGVLCTLDELATHPRTDFPVGEAVTFKGKCSGLNFDVQLDRCVEVKN